MLLFYLSALEDVCTWHVQGGGGGASTVCYYTKDDKHRLSPLYQPPHPHPTLRPTLCSQASLSGAFEGGSSKEQRIFGKSPVNKL